MRFSGIARISIYFFSPAFQKYTDTIFETYGEKIVKIYSRISIHFKSSHEILLHTERYIWDVKMSPINL